MSACVASTWQELCLPAVFKSMLWAAPGALVPGESLQECIPGQALQELWSVVPGTSVVSCDRAPPRMSGRLRILQARLVALPGVVYGIPPVRYRNQRTSAHTCKGSPWNLRQQTQGSHGWRAGVYSSSACIGQGMAVELVAQVWAMHRAANSDVDDSNQQWPQDVTVTRFYISHICVLCPMKYPSFVVELITGSRNSAAGHVSTG